MKPDAWLLGAIGAVTLLTMGPAVVMYFRVYRPWQRLRRERRRILHLYCHDVGRIGWERRWRVHSAKMDVLLRAGDAYFKVMTNTHFKAVYKTKAELGLPDWETEMRQLETSIN